MVGAGLTLVLRDYEYLSPLACGDVRPKDLQLTLIRDPNALDRTATDSSVDAGELSLSRYLTRVCGGDREFIGMPFFTTGGFRHRGFFVKRGGPIRTFRDLAGTRIGTNEWPATGNVWARAVLRDAGVRLEDIRWSLGSVDGAGGKVTQEDDVLPAYVAPVALGRTLSGMLVDGVIDALMCPRPPKVFYESNSPIVRLVTDYKAAEAEYFARTGIRPVAHIVGVRRRAYERHPEAVSTVYAALEASKLRWQARLWQLGDALPWLLPAMEETRTVFGEDWAPSGVEPNRKTLDALLDEALAQRLISRPLRTDELFQEFRDVAEAMQGGGRRAF